MSKGEGHRNERKVFKTRREQQANMNKLFSVIGHAFACLLTTGFLSLSSGCISQKYSAVPDRGFVPDKETAIRIAEAVLIPIYGKDTIDSERPFSASLENGRWVVEGALPKGMLGGVAVVEISRANGAILRVSHGK